MTISPLLMLVIGIVAASLFVLLFAVSFIIAFRNRKRIQTYSEQMNKTMR